MSFSITCVVSHCCVCVSALVCPGVGGWTNERTRERMVNLACVQCLASLSIPSGVVRDGDIWIELETEDNAHR